MPGHELTDIARVSAVEVFGYGVAPGKQVAGLQTDGAIVGHDRTQAREGTKNDDQDGGGKETRLTIDGWSEDMLGEYEDMFT